MNCFKWDIASLKKKILVVDDNQQMLEFMAHLLKEDGHEVVSAEDGFSATGRSGGAHGFVQRPY